MKCGCKKTQNMSLERLKNDKLRARANGSVTVLQCAGFLCIETEIMTTVYHLLMKLLYCHQDRSSRTEIPLKE